MQEQWSPGSQFIGPKFCKAGIIGGLIFTAVNLRLDTKARRVSNLLKITEGHRELWSKVYERPELARVLDPAVNLEETSISDQEELFVSLLVLHLSSAQEAIKQGMFAAPRRLADRHTALFLEAYPQNDLGAEQDNSRFRLCGVR